MSDETNYETNNPEGTATGSTSGTAWTATGTAERVGFCQDCGTPLTRETVRPVGAAVFCEPCLTARVGGTTQQGYSTVPPTAGVPPMDKPPSPGLAGLLSIIPGVGQMYNGQYVKGVVVLLIFAVLKSLGDADHLGIFGLAAFVWWIYQIVDAYQTAKSRVEGRPLPNPFGLNEVGERMGFGKGFGNATYVYGTTPPPYTSATPPPYTAPSQPYTTTTGPTTGPILTGPDWVGYVPPTNFASAPPAAPAAQTTAPWTQAPYTQPYAPTYSAAPPVYTEPIAPMPVVVFPPAKRFPVGAFWLIGLGVVFLIGEFAPDWGWSWHLGQNWLLAGLFAGLSAWTLVRRLNSADHSICGYRWPLILGVLAMLFVLQALDVASLGRTWPVLFIAFGGMLILERTSLGTPEFGHAYPTHIYASQTPSEAEAAERARASWSTPVTPAATQEAGTETHGAVDDSTKGGL